MMNKLPSAARTWWASIDTGKSCTDACAVNRDTGDIFTVKSPSIPDDPTSSAINALFALCKKSGLDIEDLSLIIQGTTLSINSLLRGKEARTAILVTRGFKDVLFLSRRPIAGFFCRENRPDLFSRRFVFEVSERMLPGGRVLTPLAEDEIRKLVPQFRNLGIESVAVCFLHSCQNPAHEQRAGEILKELIPHMPVTLSNEIMPFCSESERFSTTAVNVALRPASQFCSEELHDRIKSGPGRSRGMLVMQSDGSVTSARLSAKEPARSLFSSLAGGVNACWDLSLKTRRPNLIALDMGCTCTGIGIIHREKPLYAVTGSANGYPLGFPSLDIQTIGSGGHHTASADIMLGRLSPNSLISPYSLPDCDSVNNSIDGYPGPTAKALALETVTAVCSKISDAVIGMLFSKGLDPREYTLVAYGGSGPLHAAAIARAAGIPKVLVPLYPGAYSALGMLSRVRINCHSDLYAITDEADPDYLWEAFAALEEKARKAFAAAGIAADLVKIDKTVDMRYRGQLLQLNMQFPSGRIKNADLTLLGRAFNISFNANYGFTPDNTCSEITSLRLGAFCDAVNIQEHTGVKSLMPAPGQPAAASGRSVFFTESPTETPVYLRSSLFPSASLKGPSIIEQEGATTLVWPGMSALVDSYGSIIIDVGAEE
ncbi:MAG: hydantoinase/oxoprolinase family protein [Firmicutes bacterium]|nr:hydantoinase/oxoprolinase family protein [Bacillota bacterium]